MSLNRYLLAALSASLPHTIESGEYIVANAVVPTVGPAGVLIGAGLGTGLRLVLGGDAGRPGQRDPVRRRCRRLRGERRPARAADPASRLSVPRSGVAAAPGRRGASTASSRRSRHLRERRAAGLGLLTIAAHRLVYGVVTVATILVYRNYFHAVDEVDAAIADLGLLVVVTGAGFVLAAVVTPPVTARFGVRRWMVVSLVASAVLQLVPGAIYRKVPLLVAAFLLGITAQNVKICVDTLVQAHVEDGFKGRVFVLYDMVFNVALVTAAGIGALILPANGKSVTLLVVLAACYLLTAAAFAWFSRGLDLNAGTESLRQTVPTTANRPDEGGLGLPE